MASKIEDKNFYVGVTPYEHEGATYDVLNVGAGYRKGRGFYANIHAGWKTDRGGYGCCYDFSGNPLSDTIWVDVKEATKNSQKTIDEMHAGLQQAKEHIAYLFDKRDWKNLKHVMERAAQGCNMDMYMKDLKHCEDVERQVANGLKQQHESLDNKSSNNSNNSKSETTMAKKLQAADLIGKAIVKGNMSYNVKGAEGDTLTVESVTGDRTTAMPPMSMEQVEKLLAGGWTVSDTQAQPATVEEVEEVSAITPTKPVAQTVDMKPKEEKRPTGRDKFVVARVPHPGESGDGPKPTTPTKPTKTTLTEVRLVVYTTARTQQQAPRIEGFAGEDDPRWKKHYDEKQRLKDLKADAEKKNDRLRKAMKGKTKAEKEAMMAQWVVVPNDPFNASYFTDRTTGEKTYSLVMGAKYLDVAQQLVDAYNTADREAWAKAEQAVAEVKSSVVAEAVAERQAKREERQAKREAEKAAATEQPTPAATVQGYTDKDVADILKRIMAGEAIPENIKAAMAA